MKILAVIPHYFGPSHPENNMLTIGSYIEPLGRIAAVNETIVALHQQFGPNRHTLEGGVIPADVHAPERRVDIIVMAMREHNVLAELGLAQAQLNELVGLVLVYRNLGGGWQE